MTSTVLDVTVLLLCVSASVVTLGATGNDLGGTEPTAAKVADQLVTETVTVTYRSADAPNGTRTVHATRAELLGILVSERSGGLDVSETDDRFGSRARAAIADGVGRRTRIDAEATGPSADEGAAAPYAGDGAATPYAGGEAAAPSDRSATEMLRLATNGPDTAVRPPSERGIPWRSGWDRGGRDQGGISGRNGASETASNAGEESEAVSNDGVRIDAVTVGDEPPRNADVTAAIVTQPAPSGMDDIESIRIVVRRW